VDSTCPFCGAAVAHPAAGPAPARRLHRAVLLGAATMVAACGGSVDPPAPLYGGPPIDASQDAPTDAARDAALDTGPDAVMGAYGLPPLDAGKE
jgi:hypothetical protein